MTQYGKGRTLGILLETTVSAGSDQHFLIK